jgi:hypothetical protein
MRRDIGSLWRQWKQWIRWRNASSVDAHTATKLIAWTQFITESDCIASTSPIRAVEDYWWS